MTPEQQKLLKQLLALNYQGDTSKEPSKADQVKNAFAEMNIAALEILLDDTKTYQDATKEVFLEKLEELYLAHKKIGDDYFIAYQGKCGAEISHCDNCGKTGYRFVGNHSHNYFDFIFELVDENISDIYDCSRFATTETIENLECKASLEFDEDELTYFVKTPEYLYKVNAAEKAFAEICTNPPQLLDFEQLCYWVDKYAVLSERIGEYDFFEPTMKWTPFTHLYYNLKRRKDYFNTNLKLIQLANVQYKTFQTEQHYIDWIVKYYPIFDQTPYDFKYSTNIDKGFVNFNFDNKSIILFHGQECMEAYHFYNNYSLKNEELLKKYCVYNDNEYREKYNDDNFEDDLSNLNYHLQQREALSKIGIEIPFYIIKNRF